MKQKFSLKSFLSGVLATAMVFALATGVMAANRQQQATLDYPGINITVDGQTVTPKDANGNTVEPFAINGTTYLPVRGIASALGINVDWNQETKTVVLTTDSGNTATNTTNTATTGKEIFNQNGIIIYYKGITESSLYSSRYEINVQIVNNTGKDYTVQIRDLSVNGIMTDGVFSSKVASGKTANDSISLYNLEKDGISAPITTAEFKFHIFNYDDGDDIIDSDVITVS